MDAMAYRKAEGRLWESAGLVPRESWAQIPRLGVRVRIQEVGEGAPLLFLHPGMSAGSCWVRLLPSIVGFRRIVVDRPGAGPSPPTEIRGEVRAFASELMLGILDALELDKVHLVASSFGSYYALSLALASAQRVRRVVHLSCPALIPGMDVPGPLRLLGTPVVNRWLVRLLSARRTSAGQSFVGTVHPATLAAGRIPAELCDWETSLIRDTETLVNELAYWERMFGIRGIRQSARLSAEELRQITVPNLFLWGDQDPMGGPDIGRNLVSLMPKARLEVFPRAGHLVWLDAPEAAAEATRTFLAEARC